MKDILVEIVPEIDVSQAYADLSHSHSGGICVFVGTVRAFTDSEQVMALEFEAYGKMALLEMEKIAKDAKEKWGLNSVVIRHVTGHRKVGEAVVITGASAPHRKEAFQACSYLIDTLKERVPIWKKELFKDSSVWVSSHP